MTNKIINKADCGYYLVGNLC